LSCLVYQLTQADLTNASLLSELFQRLDHYLLRIAGRVDLIPISPDDIYHQLQLVEDTGLDRDDALILASILSHAQTYPTIKKSLLTTNVNDFRRPPVKDLMNVAGLRLFSSTLGIF
jgi:hypothetical protein